MSQQQQQHLLPQPPRGDYDPRRLFPFGLSPIPEVPSELASEDSSVCGESPTPSEYEDEEEEGSDETEVESVRSAILYSGSCSSVKSNNTLADEDDDTEEEEEEESGSEESYSEEEEEEEEEDDCKVMTVTHQRSYQCQPTPPPPPLPPLEIEEENAEKEAKPAFLDPKQLEGMSGAETASEIFRHLQATREKDEVTTELAKILSVLETTLNHKEKKSENKSEDSSEAKRMLLLQASSSSSKKPPRHPNSKVKSSKDDEMSILSKILVTLLCSCKSVVAAEELKKIIRQFREAAKEAADEVGGDDILAAACGGSGGKRKSLRVRRSSGSSNASCPSEAESLTNTLTPNNTDSKSSEDEDKIGIRVSEDECTTEATVSVTITLPRRSSDPDAADDAVTAIPASQQEDEWDEDNNAMVVMESPRTRRLKQFGRNDSTSSDSASKDLSSDSAGRDGSSCASETTRKLLSDMECGAYNSDSLNSSGGHSGLSGCPQEVSDEGGWTTDDDTEDEHHRKRKKKKRSVEGKLINHLEETFKVLNGAYRIITGSRYNSDNEEEEEGDRSEIEERSFEEVLEDVSSQCAKLENEMRKSTTPRENKAATPPPSVRPRSQQQNRSRPQSRNNDNATRPLSRNNDNAIRPLSRNNDNARPLSRLRSRPVSRQTDTEGEQDWGDDWEYYYEEEGEEEDGAAIAVAVDSKPFEEPVAAATSMDTLAPPTIAAVIVKGDSRPSSRGQQQQQQRKLVSSSRPSSRPSSRTSNSRPGSRSSRLGMRTPLKGIGENEDEDEDGWEWEYYDDEEDEDELQRLSPTANTAPTTRATSPFPQQQVCYRTVRKEMIEVNKSLVMQWEETFVLKPFAMPPEATAIEKQHWTTGLINPISEVSVALAAEYLGQTTSDVVASLNAEFYSQPAAEKKRHHHGRRSGSSRGHHHEDPDKEEKKKRRRKKKRRSGEADEEEEEEEDDGKFLPKLGVKDLVSRLEPRLFKDATAGTKMVMSSELARTAILDKKKKSTVNSLNAGADGKKRKSVKEMVQLISNHQQQLQQQPTVVDPMDAKCVGRVIIQQEGPPGAALKPRSPPVPPPMPNSKVAFRQVANTDKVEVVQGNTSTVVQMRSKQTGARQKERAPSKSPEGSLAYGTGSSSSSSNSGEDKLPAAGAAAAAAVAVEEQPKANNRHSRLFKLLQDSDYTDSDSSEAQSDYVVKADCTTSSLSRKHSFKSVCSDGDSVDNKGSSPLLNRKKDVTVLAKRVFNLNLQSCYESEQQQYMNGGGGMVRKQSNRVWSYLQDEFMDEDTSIDSSSLATPDGSTGVSGNDDILFGGSRRNNRAPPLSREHSFKSCDMSSPIGGGSVLARNSPKFEMELMDLANFPPAASALNLRVLQQQPRMSKN